MSQLNINVTPEFEDALRGYMQKKGIAQKTQAIRQALYEAIERIDQASKGPDYRAWIGLAIKAPLRAKRKFKDEDALWEGA